MEPFEKKKTEEELVGEVLVNKAIKNKIYLGRFKKLCTFFRNKSF
jgi:hypothetical protein